MRKIKDALSLIRFSHSIFALPFALSAMLVAAKGVPSLKIFLLILVAMVTGRSAAMAFNRWTDAAMDARNPRTQIREIPQGKLSRTFALGLTIFMSALFILTTYFLNPLCFTLAPMALLILFFYSYTKRFTPLCHFFVGLALGISPVGAWIAVTGQWAWPPVFLGLAILFWVGGFDIIYATQDYEFDKKEGLHSIPARLGIPLALKLSALSHLLTLVFFSIFGSVTGLNIYYFAGILLIALFLAYEHFIVKADDLSKVNAAFFQANGIISVLFLVSVALSLTVAP